MLPAKAESRLNIGVITGSAITWGHGSGVQILRVFEGADVTVRHLFWSTHAGRDDGFEEHALLNRLTRVRGYHLRRVADGVVRLLGLAWWDCDRVDARKLRNLLEANGWMFDVAYVSIATEQEARRAHSIVKALRCPYVLHMMDLCHEEGIDPETMPGYRALIGSASAVLIVSEPMRREVLKLRTDGVDLVNLGKEVTKEAEAPPDANGKVRIVMLGSVGSPDNPALELLAEALPMIREKHPNVEFLYMGQHYGLLPDRLKPQITWPGRIDIATFERMLPSAHITFVPSPHRRDCYARFAPLGRLVDIFMAGLPVLYHVAKGSLAERFLSTFTPDAAQAVVGPSEMVEAVEHFREPENWQRANRRLRSYAMEHFDIARLRDHVMTKLAQAAHNPSPKKGAYDE